MAMAKASGSDKHEQLDGSDVRESPYPIAVRRIDIARFASAIGAADADYFGSPPRGGGEMEAPPGFHFALSSGLRPPSPDDVRLADGRVVEQDGDVPERALAAGTEIEFLSPIKAGCDVTVQERLISREPKMTSVGSGEFVLWERVYIDGDGNRLIKELHSVFFQDEQADIGQERGG